MLESNQLGINSEDNGQRSDGSPTRPVIENVTTYSSFAEAEGAWRAFEDQALSTPYQRFDWLEAWYRHIGADSELEPLIVVASSESGAPALLWPLVVRDIGTARVASWQGGKFANYNMGLYNREVVGLLDKNSLVPVMGHLRTEAEVDALTLKNQPESWQGTTNPLVRLPYQPSPSNAYSLALRPDFDALYAELRSGSTRKKMRRSERRIVADFGSCDLRRPQTAEEVDRVLDVFFAQKADRMLEKNIHNVFADHGVPSFFREIAVRGIGAEDPLLDLFWIDAGGSVAATWAGTTSGGRLCGIINSFDPGEISQHQPGEVLLRHIIQDCCERGLREFDLGVGEAQYKDSWCPRIDNLFDSFLPLSTIGWMHTSVAMTGFRLKRVAKQSMFLRDLIDRLR